MGGLPAFFQGIFTLLSGAIGVAIVGILLIIGVVESVNHKSMRPFLAAMVGGGAFYAIPWLMSVVMQGGG
jgi:hypothetical protein